MIISDVNHYGDLMVMVMMMIVLTVMMVSDDLKSL